MCPVRAILAYIKIAYSRGMNDMRGAKFSPDSVHSLFVSYAQRMNEGAGGDSHFWRSDTKKLSGRKDCLETFEQGPTVDRSDTCHENTSGW